MVNIGTIPTCGRQQKWKIFHYSTDFFILAFFHWASEETSIPHFTWMFLHISIAKKNVILKALSSKRQYVRLIDSPLCVYLFINTACSITLCNTTCWLYICLRNLILCWKSVLLLWSRRCCSLQFFEICGVYELFELSEVFVH